MKEVAIFLNDILITDTNIARHIQNLRKKLQLLQDEGLVKKETCAFFSNSISYLGFV